MPLSKKIPEIKRLIKSFEIEANKFPEMTFSVEYLSKTSTSFSHTVSKKHHGILLWQFNGSLANEEFLNSIAENAASGNLKWGIPGSELSCIGIIEGELYPIFLKMAVRAGALFDSEEMKDIKIKVMQEIVDSELAKNNDSKPAVTTNSHPLAVWLNYLLFYLSSTNPGRERVTRIEPEPFSLSLLALEDILRERTTGKINSYKNRLKDIAFKVALSFPGERREYVEQVVNELKPELGEDAVFYDFDYQSFLAAPNVDIILQTIYRKQSDIVVVFICEDYALKEWCGLEWRAIRDMIKSGQGEKIMLVRFDDVAIDGLFSIDGFLDARNISPEKLSKIILTRLHVSTSTLI